MRNTSYITALRFPLALLVVLIHTYNSSWQLIETGSAPTPAWFAARVLPTFAVPMFFAVSGYLFFLNIRAFTAGTYIDKLRRRMLTLAVPYVVWNLIAFGLYALQDISAGRALQYAFSPDLFWGCRNLGGESVSAPGWIIGAATAPVQQPLWFVRDLIVLAVLSPLFYAALRHRIIGPIVLLLLGAVYYGELWPNFGGVSFMGPWFFGLGAWAGIRRLDVPAVTRPALKPALALLPVCGVALMWFPGGDGIIHLAAQGVYVFAAGISAIHIASFFTQHRRPSRLWAGSSFFVYAAHTIVLLPLTTRVAPRVADCGTWVQGLAYLACAFTATLLCVAVYAVLQHYSPRASAPLTGQIGR